MSNFQGQPQAQPNTALLINEIQKYVRNGWRVMQQTPTSAQLIKPKKFSLFWALMWFLLAGIGILVYIFYYMAKKDETLYLHLDGNHVKATRG